MSLKLKQLVGLLSVIFLTSCVKSRPDMFSPQISDPSQFLPIKGAIQAIDEKAGIEPGNPDVHKITTDDYQSRGNTIDAQNVRLDGAGFEFPVYVKVQTKAPLLKDSLDMIRLYGLPNKEYKLTYEFTPKYLKIFKVTPDSEITHYEKTVSKKNKDGAWLVPIGGYRVSYFQKYKVPDSDNRATNIISYKDVAPENFKALATHFVYDSESFIAFKNEQKSNLYPSDYFDGEWYFATTIVATKPGEESNLGYFDSSMDSSLRKTATRVKFLRSREFLRAVNTVVDSRIKVSDEQLDDVLNIPAEWLDYEIVKNDNYDELEEKVDNSTNFNERPFVKLDFKMTKSLITGDESQLDAYFKGLELSDISYTKDTFSFTLLRISTGVKRKFSFKRIPEENTYKPKVYTFDDQKVYGYFSTKLERLIDIGLSRRSDYEKDLLANRFNLDKKIVFKFSKQTPLANTTDVYGLKINYRKIGENAVRYWNQVFKFMGAKNGVVLDQSEDNELGDFDSNTINIITNLAADGSGGVGPTVADPVTGEIINGTVNVYSATTVSGVSNDLRNLLKIERGLIIDTVFSKKIRERGIMSGLKKEVQYFCPEILSFAKATKGQLLKDSTEENKVIYSCLEKIVPKRIEAIVVHEMGHTLGLRHNFYGSFDEHNSFKSIKELESIYPRSEFPDLYAANLPKNDESMLLKYSSVMDYFRVWFDGADGVSLSVPSMYDISALAYLYMNKLPKTGKDLFNGFVTVDADKDIGQNISASKLSVKKAMYCTDEQALNRAKPPAIIDSGCALHDKGQTYTQIMDFYFNAFRDDLFVLSKKLDKASLNDASGYLQGSVTKMAIVYMDWRFKLSKLMSDPGNTRLVGYSESEFSDLLDKVKTSNSEIKDDADLSKKYFNYMSEISEMSNYYCITKNKANEVNVHEFSKLQKKLINSTVNSQIESCFDEVIKTDLAQEHKETIVGEIGLPVQSLQFSQRSEDSKESFDIIGVGAIRQQAISMMGILNPLLYFNAINGFKPSLLDEPAIYSLYKKKIESRILKGLNISDQLNYAFETSNMDLKVPSNKVFKKFKEENVIYDTGFVTLVNSNLGTDSSGPKRNLLSDFEIGKTSVISDIPSSSTSVKIAEGYYYASPDSKWSTSLINTYKQIKNPVNVDINILNPELKTVFDALVSSVEDLPVVASDNYVVRIDSLGAFINKMGNMARANQSNTALITELNLAFSNYDEGASNTSALFRAEQLNGTTGQSEFDIAGAKVSYAKIADQIESLRTEGLSLATQKQLGFKAPLSQEAVVGNYLRSKDQALYNYWKTKFDINSENVKDFESQELSTYKAYLESRIANR